MNPKNRAGLAERVVGAAEASLAAQGYVSAIDVLVGIGWLDPGAVQRWRRGQIDCLEAAVQTNLPRISEAMKLFRAWAARKGLFASETDYVARTPLRQALRFSVSGNPTIERLYRTHWVSPELSEKKCERLAEKASRAPELIVILPVRQDPLFMNIILTVTAKGQLTLPKELLEHLGVRPSDRLEIELLPQGRVQARAKPKRPVSTIFGIMKCPGDRAMTIEEIKGASAAAWAGER